MDEDRLFPHPCYARCPECGMLPELHRHRINGQFRFTVRCSNRACTTKTPPCPCRQAAVRVWKAYTRLSL